MRFALPMFMAVWVTATTVTLGQLVPPTEGYQLGGPVNLNYPGGIWYDIIMSSTVAQCEPVLIYYNVTSWTGDGPLGLILYPPDPVEAFVSFYFPLGKAGYLEWICNIPAGESFIAATQMETAAFVVQPGSSSACLGALTTTYNSVLQYNTSVFASYTATLHPTFTTSAYVERTTFFPTGTFSTLTLNLAEASGTSQTLTSTSISGPVYSSGSNQAPKNMLAGTIVGIVIGVVGFLLVVALAFCLWRRHSRKPGENPPYGPPHEIAMDSFATTMAMSRNQAAQNVRREYPSTQPSF